MIFPIYFTHEVIRKFNQNCRIKYPRNPYNTLLEKFTWLVTEKARDGKYPHSTGKFTDTMRVKDQIEYFDFDFSSFFFQNTMELDWI
jgi:hypothetical protein